MPAIKASRAQAVHIAAVVFAIALFALALATITRTAHADNILKEFFPAGRYRWGMPNYRVEPPQDIDVMIGYDRSSEIKTFISAAVSLLIGLLGIYTFVLSPLRPTAKPLLQHILLVTSTTAFIVSLVCVVWSAVAEPQIKKSTCWFDYGATANATYLCSVENAACNTLRFIFDGDHTRSEDGTPIYMSPSDNTTPDDLKNAACLGFRHARFMMIPMTVISLVMAGLYAAMVWMGPKKDYEEAERAERRVEALRE